MKFIQKLTIILAVFISFNVVAKEGKIIGGADYEIPAWFTDSFLDISDDVEDASDENKSVLLYFHLDGCPYCDAMLVQNFKSGFDCSRKRTICQSMNISVKVADTSLRKCRSSVTLHWMNVLIVEKTLQNVKYR
jgi:thioredoxin-related protein